MVHQESESVTLSGELIMEALSPCQSCSPCPCPTQFSTLCIVPLGVPCQMWGALCVPLLHQLYLTIASSRQICLVNVALIHFLIHLPLFLPWFLPFFWRKRVQGWGDHIACKNLPSWHAQMHLWLFPKGSFKIHIWLKTLWLFLNNLQILSAEDPNSSMVMIRSFSVPLVQSLSYHH